MLEEDSVSGLRSGLYLHHLPDSLGLRCCPSSLYTFPAASCRAWLGIATWMRFPRLWAVLHRRFPKRALKFFSSPLRLPFRHARVAGHLHQRIIEQAGW